MRIVIVNATAVRSSGGLTIYNQFISHLANNVGENEYYIFVDPAMARPKIDGVTFICDDNHSWLHRIYWDFWGCRRWLKKRKIKADIIVSLQNTGILTSCRQIIYFHQSLPFYSQKWNLFKKSERIMALYKYVYPYFVSLTLNKRTEVVVQIPFMKSEFKKKFHIEEDKVHVLSPDIEKIAIERVAKVSLPGDECHFVYPANNHSYKKHTTLVKAVECLKQRNSSVFNKVKIYLTLDQNDCKSLVQMMKDAGVENQFILKGKLPHEGLLSLYKSANGLLFPSTIESFGLPLIEAARFGLPIIASNQEYARNVVGRYEGVTFIESTDYVKWADTIENVCVNQPKYAPLVFTGTSWNDFFALI